MDPHHLVLPLEDGSCVRLAQAQAVVGRLLVKAAERQPDGLNDGEAAEMMHVLDRLQTEARPLRHDDLIRDGDKGQVEFLKLILRLAHQLQDTLRVTCIRCGRQLSADSDDAQLGLTADGKPVFYCIECCPRGFGKA